MSKSTILGSEQEVINYHLNEKFSSLKKVIIPSNEFIKHCSPRDSLDSIFDLLTISSQDKIAQKEEVEENLKNITISDQFHKEFQEQLKTLSKEIDVHLKDYNFMSSVSNTRYTLVLRTESSAYYKYFLEKGSLLQTMKLLLFEFALSECKTSSNCKKFQFECFESEDIYKTIFMKKENHQLFLYGFFGTMPPTSLNAVGGGEIYHSINENFQFFSNKQEYAFLRQHGVLDRCEINKQEKVLNSEELKTINENTKHIDNVLLEMYLTRKGQLKIVSVLPNEKDLGIASEKGCVILKSNKNYNKISLITLNECRDSESSNPLYLLIKNEFEFQEMLREIDALPIDGIVATYNCYHPIMERFAEQKDLDIIYYNEPLQRSLEVTINWEDFSIEGATSSNKENPFSSIISSENKEKDELLEKLKNIDLSSNTESNSKEREDIASLTQSMTASSNSSNSIKGGEQKMPTHSNGEKKSAIGMLADAALNAGPKKEETPQQESAHQEQSEANYQESETPTYQESEQAPQRENTPQDFGKSNLDGFFSESSIASQEVEEVEENNNSEEETSRYDYVLATKLFTPPAFQSQGHIVDTNSISLIQDNGEIILVVSSKQEMSNPSLTYALPVTSDSHSQAYSIISSAQDFFLFRQIEETAGAIVNLCTIEEEIKESVLKEMCDCEGEIKCIVYKNDLPLLERYIPFLEMIYVKDVENQEDVEEARNLLLAFEKRHLLRN